MQVKKSSLLVNTVGSNVFGIYHRLFTTQTRNKKSKVQELNFAKHFILCNYGMYLILYVGSIL